MTKRKLTGPRLFAGLVIVLVAAAVGAGLFLSGTPGQERARQFDAVRLNNIQQIAGAVDSFYNRNNRLPADLDALVASADQATYLVGSLNDPQTKAPYQYDTQGDSTYELCAVFDLASEKAETAGLKPAPAATEPVPAAQPAPLVTEPGAKARVRTWEHGAGRFCFQLNATDVLGAVTCGLTNPCPTGQTCAALPENKGTRCVPQGHECEAAGCPGRCILDESYPAQVVCQAPPAAGAAPTCKLMKNPKTGVVGCYGCANGTCTKLPTGWEDYAPPQAGVGIPYACFAGKGCELAQ